MHGGKGFQPPLDVSQVMGCKHRIVSDISTPNSGQCTRVKFRYIEIPKYNMQICNLKITLQIVRWVVFRTRLIHQKDTLKGAEVIFGERYSLVMHCLHSSRILYIVWYG